MIRCVLQSTDGLYYRFNHQEPTIHLDDALLFESRWDAEWERDNNPTFKNGKIISVFLCDDGSTKPFKECYFVISYKPDHADYCRGCFMRHFKSRHEMEILPTEEAVAKHIVKLDKSVDSLDDEFLHWVLTQDEIFGDFTYLGDSYGRVPYEIKDLVKSMKSEEVL